jgi:hypothetical protein
MSNSTHDQRTKILSLSSADESGQPTTVQVTSPPRRVPSLYPTAPPTSSPITDENLSAVSYRPIAHSMRPKATPITIESLREQRNAIALANEESNEQSLYDLFEVDPNVSEEELRRAYKRMWSCFHPDHFSTYGLYSRAQLEALLNQLQEAFERLMDPQKRRSYDAEFFPNGMPQSRSKPKPQSNLAPTLQPLISLEEAKQTWPTLTTYEHLGQRLKDLREQFNISLTAVHERSKISISVLANIEQDHFEALPAPIYLKGFVKEILVLYSLENLVDLDRYIALYLNYRST